MSQSIIADNYYLRQQILYSILNLFNLPILILVMVKKTVSIESYRRPRIVPKLWTAIDSHVFVMTEVQWRYKKPKHVLIRILSHHCHSVIWRERDTTTVQERYFWVCTAIIIVYDYDRRCLTTIINVPVFLWTMKMETSLFTID